MSWEGEKGPIGLDPNSTKAMAMNLLDQIIEMERLDDIGHVRLLAEKHIYRNGESAVSHHLKVLKELVARL